ncbi:MAG: hypothetical protein BIFFINMI_00572 [Phycisphaerae bacterium]|nr:hypothetical protein [Phycisphaerae bacterium]
MRTTLVLCLCGILFAAIGCGDKGKSDARGGDGAKAPPDASKSPASDLDRKMYGDAAPPGGDTRDMVLTFTPPDGWKVAEKPASSTLLVASRPLKPDDKYADNLSLTKGPAIVLKDKTLDGFEQTTMKGLETTSANIQIISSKSVKVGDVQAKEIVFTCSKYGGWDMPWKVKMWLVLGYRGCYNLTAHGLQSTFAEYEPAFDAAAQTLRWVPETP